MTQPIGSGAAVPGVAATAGDAFTGDRDSTTTSSDDGVPVGAADAEADAARTGASDTDDTRVKPGEASAPDLADTPRTDEGVSVGEADAEADRRRTTDDDDAD
jgi:hypothetical protein